MSFPISVITNETISPKLLDDIYNVTRIHNGQRHHRLKNIYIEGYSNQEKERAESNFKKSTKKSLSKQLNP